MNIHVRALKNSFWTPERDLELIEAIKAEKSWGEIAGEMGKHPSAVAGRIKRLKDAGAVVIPNDYRIRQVVIANKARFGKPLKRPAAVLDENFQIIGIQGVANLESHHCRFECTPNDRFDAAEPLFCGHTVESGSFCAHHRAVVYQARDDRMGAAR